jgi:exonuclease SbcD
VRFIHTADLNLGFNTFNREKNYSPIKSLDFAVTYAIQNKVDLFLIAGDVFDKRDPVSFIQKEFAEEIKKLVEKNITVFIVTGNHEGAPSPERNIHLDIYNALRIKGVFIAKKIKLFKLPMANIISIPYPYKRNLLAKEEYRDKSEKEVASDMNRIIVNSIKEYASVIQNGLPTILTAHIPIAEGKVGSEVYSTFSTELPISLSELDIKGISYIALGHLHTKQLFTTKKYEIPAVYSGSIDRIDFGEENDKKGFFDVKIKKGEKPVLKFIENPFARKFYSVKIKQDADMQIIDFDRAKESITRIVLYNDIENEKMFKEIVKKLQNNALVFAGIEDKREFSTESNFSHMNLSIKPTEAIKKYIDEKKVFDKFIEAKKDKIFETAINILKELEES